MSEEGRIDNAALATEQLVKHHANTGAVLTLLDLQRWFADELKSRPSVTTLAKARRAFLETLRTPDCCRRPKTEPLIDVMPIQN